MTDSTKPVAIAIIGAGAWGKNHVRNFAGLPGAELRYVCDPSGAARERARAHAPKARLTESVQDVLEDESVQAVVVATDAPSHAKLALEAMQRGKDVLVEKPLALSSADAEAMCQYAEQHGRILMVGHLLMYHPAVRALRELIIRGDLGDVLYIYTQRLNLGVVRPDENAWWSLAPHDISIANYLLDAEPEHVSASGAVFLQPAKGIEDVVFASLYYPQGKIAHVHVSWLDPHKTRRLTVVGSRKMAVFDDTSADEKLRVFDKGVEPPAALSYEQGVRVRTGEIRIPPLQMAEPLSQECRAFLDAVRTRQAPLASGRSGLSVVRALEAGSRSLRRAGQRVSTP